MHDFIEQLKNMDRNQLILTAAKLKKESQAEPIAVVGIGCRFPGGIDSAKSFWEKIAGGMDAVDSIADKRWSQDEFFDADPDAPGKSYVRHMALLEKPDHFDAAFFNIHKTEADLMDPQQRWLMEDTWHALEDANVNPTSLTGRNVGVYVGLMNHDYEHLQNLTGDISKVSGYSAVGSATSVAAGRLAYFYGLQGPAITLDTACSSSLVAVHLACQALRQRECEMALAGGVNAILSPTTTIAESKAMMLSPSGKCHTYDEKADGYVRGEGCGILVLKRLSDAKKNGDRIYAVIRGSAVNQDGASQGLTSPNGLAQQKVINHALIQAGIEAEEVGFVETHGTGTPLGDPIEIGALCQAYKTRQRGQPLYISSLKTNFGHTESAAGVAGLIKVCLSRFYGQLLQHLNLTRLNPYIDLQGQNLVILDNNRPWPADAPFGAVSSFGFSGTNAHIILGSGPNAAPVEMAELSERAFNLPPVITASAAHPDALAELVASYKECLADISLDKTLMATASHHCRAHLPYRAAWCPGTEPLIAKQRRTGSRRLCALFPGQGAQRKGMGSVFYQQFRVFRETIDACDQIFRPHHGFSIRDVMWGERAEELHHTQFTQPAIYVYELAMMRLWHHWGIRPDMLLGHSVGEYAAACYAGVFSLEDGMRLIMARGEYMQLYCQPGAMLAVVMSEKELHSLLPEHPTLSLAANNGTDAFVIAGPINAVDVLENLCQLRGIRCRRLQVSHAFHSPMMEPMIAAFSAVAGKVKFQLPTIPMVSSTSGENLHQTEADADYWIQHIRMPVQFARAAQSTLDTQVRYWLEMGPDQILCGLIRPLVEQDSQHHWLGLQPKKNTPEVDQLMDTVAALYTEKWDMNWLAIDETRDLEAAKRTPLPLYPFRPTGYWYEAERVFTHSRLPINANHMSVDDSGEDEIATGHEKSDLRTRLINLDTESQWLTLVSMTRGHIGSVLNMEEEEIPLDVDIFDLGLDSMKAMDLRAKVQDDLGYDLSARLLFEHPNVLSLVDYFGLELLKLWEVSPVAEELA